uniref:Ankyrin repeat domain 53 n=1 Tax=Lepisosteus oculatus TaxID=7918 RepID=W5M0K3_LEPOC
MFQAAAAGDTAWLRLSLRGVTSAAQPGRNGLTVLHVAALHGRLECLRLLLEVHHMDVNTGGPGGWRPVHLAISSRTGARASTCLSYLLARGAQPSVRSDDGTTPLHRAAGEGLLDCTVTLVQAGAELSARDGEGHTPLDTAKLWGYRAIARYRRLNGEGGRPHPLSHFTAHMSPPGLHPHSPLSARELTEHQSYVTAGVSNLDLGMLCGGQRSRSRQHSAGSSSSSNSASSGHTKSCSKKHREAWNRSTNPARTPRAAISRPHGVRLGTHPEEEARDPDLTGCVVLTQGWDRQTLIMPAWGGRPLPAPPLPQDVLHRSLFPRSHLSRITSPCDLVPTHLQDLPRRRHPSTDGSPWTEVAMHLSEALQPGHY